MHRRDPHLPGAAFLSLGRVACYEVPASIASCCLVESNKPTLLTLCMSVLSHWMQTSRSSVHSEPASQMRKLRPSGMEWLAQDAIVSGRIQAKNPRMLLLHWTQCMWYTRVCVCVFVVVLSVTSSLPDHMLNGRGRNNNNKIQGHSAKSTHMILL